MMILFDILIPAGGGKGGGGGGGGGTAPPGGNQFFTCGLQCNFFPLSLVAKLEF